MNKLLITCLLLTSAVNVIAQISYGGEPYNWPNKQSSSSILFNETALPDYDRLAMEDAITDQHKDVPYRFGVEYSVDYNLENSGQWLIDNDKNLAIWQLGISCPGALAICLRFDSFKIPKGGNVYIWSADREEFIGSFNHNSNKDSGKLATSLIHGNKVIVEYSVSLDASDRGELAIGQVVHSYRSFMNSKFVTEALQQRGPFGNSGDCEVNVNCPDGADWQVEKRTVAIITEGGYGYCTGALVNNTANDGTPYFLTANHCTNGANVGNWVFYFNHESISCSGTIAPTNQSISGSALVANHSISDFALLLLDDTPPASFDVQYAGWDATDDEDAVQSAVCIHHPSGDIKKISFEEDAPYHDIGNGAQVWWIDDWELGVTEPGSSGSPLFDQNHRVIGQLFGGASACSGNNGNGLYDFYGRFGVSWDYGSSVSSRLREWLDPGNTGILVLDGYPDGFVSASIDPGAASINNVPATICGSTVSPSFTLYNYGSENLVSCTIFYQINNNNTQNINWTGSLAQNASANISIPTFTAANGSNTLTVWISNPNGSADENTFNNQLSVTFSAISGDTYIVSLNLTLDEYPEETSWQITNSNNNVLYSGGLYSDATPGSSISQDFCLASGCYEFTINDEYNDGICCSFGNGFYEVIDPNGIVVADGGDFNSSESTEFCLSANNSVDENDIDFFVAFPNPADNKLNVRSSENILRIDLSDVAGRLILSSNPSSQWYTLSTESFPNGIYNLTMMTAKSTKTSKLVIKH